MKTDNNQPLVGLREWPVHMREFERARLEEVKAAIIRYVQAGEPVYNEWLQEYHFLREQVEKEIPALPPNGPVKLADGSWALNQPAK